MAKQSMLQREFKRQKLVRKYRAKREQIVYDLKTAKNLKDIFVLQRSLQKLPGNSLPIRLRNRCWKTGRSRGFYRDFGLSRHVLREMAHDCLLPGVTKSSW
uniref:Small ribosomal subunit protein uS14c n=1 Tax=Rhizochromulina marina TaxID=1034831 RepID=A0A514CPY2_9STRA|nr:ribosomal protein S14 [Rhizochromulina marina]QDH81861.1 ribosomal protein S14 [Rhizochromulina marina]